MAIDLLGTEYLCKAICMGVADKHQTKHDCENAFLFSYLRLVPNALSSLQRAQAFNLYSEEAGGREVLSRRRVELRFYAAPMQKIKTSRKRAVRFPHALWLTYNVISHHLR
jgi:hypothetical protein